MPLVATMRAPLIAPAGTVTVKEVAEAAVEMTVFPPPKLTTLLAAVVEKLVPVITIALPIPAIAGANEVIDGTGRILKLFVEAELVTPLMVKESLPVTAPAGITTLM